MVGSGKYRKVVNIGILKSTITDLKSTKLFERPLIDQ